jgi:hypothetical protein
VLKWFKNSSIFYWLLLGYHLIFTYFAYEIRVERGKADSLLYWFQNEYTHGKSWLDFFHYGTDFILFINYPFVKMGIPYWGGFLLYSSLGFLGILQWIRWAKVVMKGLFINYKTNFLWFIFLLPNLHYWTASLGKEALLFWGIASIFFAFATRHFKSISFVLGSLLLVIIRPHVALMLFASIVLLLLFQKSYSLKKRILLFSSASLLLLSLTYMSLQIASIRYWNWQRIQHFNEYSILSFKHSGSYVPMLGYTYFYKIFSFHFRPLFFDSHNTAMVFASMENLLMLIIFISALLVVIRFYAQLVFSSWMKLVFWFTFLTTVVYIERYANLGIFMRTKMMIQPFLLVALLHIIRQGYNLYQKHSKT